MDANFILTAVCVEEETLLCSLETVVSARSPLHATQPSKHIDFCIFSVNKIFK